MPEKAQANFLQVLPEIPYDFLKELLDILGKPNSVYVRAMHPEKKINGLKLQEEYAERECECGIEKILDIYSNSGKMYPVGLSKLEWTEIDKKLESYRCILSAKFTPREFSLEIDKTAKGKKYKRLTDLIEKYKVANKIELLFPMEPLIQAESSDISYDISSNIGEMGKGKGEKEKREEKREKNVIKIK